MEPAEVDGAGSISSMQIQSAIDQLNYVQRILHGDDGMSFSDLLASAASASGPSPSLPLGGLSKALPALLAPLLSGAETNTYGYDALSQQALLAKRAAFQPRRYLAMTADLVARTADTQGEMHRGIQLAQLLRKQSNTDIIKKTNRQKILQDRRAKRAAIDQQQMNADHTTKMKEASMKQAQSFDTGPSSTFASMLHGQAKQMEPDLKAEPDENIVQIYLQAWQLELNMTDGEASGRLQVTLQQTIQSGHRKCFLLRMQINQLGFAWVLLRFHAISSEDWCARVDRVNVLAESEVEDSTSDDYHHIALQSSRFPLYRHISLLLNTRLMQIKVKDTPSWTHLTTALFALSALCRLNELPLQSNYVAPVEGMPIPLRGQDSILNAFAHLDMDSSSHTKTVDPPSSPPGSALFSDSHSQ
jgi:hypothetical protein